MQKDLISSLVTLLKREMDYYLRIITVIDESTGDRDVAYVRDDVLDSYADEEELTSVLDSILVEISTANYHLQRYADSLIYQFSTDTGRVVVSLDPECARYNNIIEIGDQCTRLVKEDGFKFEPRHPLPNESNALPDMK